MVMKQCNGDEQWNDAFYEKNYNENISIKVCYLGDTLNNKLYWRTHNDRQELQKPLPPSVLTEKSSSVKRRPKPHHIKMSIPVPQPVSKRRLHYAMAAGLSHMNCPSFRYVNLKYITSKIYLKDLYSYSCFVVLQIK